MYQVCYVCKQEKPIQDFHLCKAKANGYSHKCKQCTKEYDTIHRKEYYKRTEEGPEEEDAEEEKGPTQQDYMMAMMADQIASLQNQLSNSEVRKEVIRDKDGLIKEIVERRVGKS